MEKRLCNKFVAWLLLVFLMGVGTYFVVGYIYNLYTYGYGDRAGRAHIVRIDDEQTALNFEITKTFWAYEKVIQHYIDVPSPSTRQTLLTTASDLDSLLRQTGPVFGLNVVRWVNLFHVWQYEFTKQLLKNPAAFKSSYAWSDVLGIYSRAIGGQITRSSDSYRLENFSAALRDLPLEPQKPSYELQRKVTNLYNTQLKALLPKLRQQYQRATSVVSNPSACLAPSANLNQPKTLAANIISMQYMSRYCPFLVRTKVNTLCDPEHRLPLRDPTLRESNMLTLALCQIATQRLANEAREAQQKYGGLSDTDYFERYVQPLIPTYRKKLRLAAKGRGAFKVCDPKQLPVVDFRDPTVDAQVAVFELYGAQYCTKSFEENRIMSSLMTFKQMLKEQVS